MTDPRQAHIPSEDDIATFLQSRTTWPGPAPELWRRALDASVPPTAALSGRCSDDSKTPTVQSHSRWHAIRRLTPARLSLAAGLVLASILTLWFTTTRVNRPAVTSSITRYLELDAMISADRFSDSVRNFDSVGYPSPAATPPSSDVEHTKSDVARYTPGSLEPADAPSRLVVRKATIELLAPDVRAAFAKAQHLLRADLGEYAEASTLTGDGPTAQAQLTLRISAARLDTVLNELRPLGKVHAEHSNGDDVTAQAVDLDARLRNERRVEAELLELLTSRVDAPLADILTLRDKLSTIRQEIERLQARRDTLGRQVSLATVLVIIRSDGAPTPIAGGSSFLNGLGLSLSAGIHAGARTLTASLAFIVELAVAGAVWWAILLIAALALRRHLVTRPKVSI